MLLERNQYFIHFGYRCNYRCSYCTGREKRKQNPGDSWIEQHTPEVIRFFNGIEPGLITVTGGEPLLWKDFPQILDETPNQRWVIITNLSSTPAWLRHPNVKMVIVTYHAEFADPKKLGVRLNEIRQDGVRVLVKLIVSHPNEYQHTPLWEKWNAMGVPSHLVPLEFCKGGPFASSFLDDLLTKYRTSALLNGYFFRKGRRGTSWFGTPCAAGTKRLFGIMSNGYLHRCGHGGGPIGGKPVGSISNPKFDPKSKTCKAPDCFCMNHFWADLTPVNDNETWRKYIEDNVWVVPTEEEVRQFLEGMGWNYDSRRIKD